LSEDTHDKAVIGLVLRVGEDGVLVDIGGAKIRVLSPFEEVKEGDIVLIHEGFVIRVMDKGAIERDVKELEGNL
jgi:hydrogenase maturation factor